MTNPSLLAFFAHPDDEAFSCGGTLAAAAAQGIETHVVCATRGERGGSAEDLATVRSQELARSCQLLGATPHHLDLPDGELAGCREQIADRLQPIVDRLDPDVLISMGPDGAYGHLDHVVCSEVLSTVAGDRTVLHVVFPPGLFGPLRKRLKRAPVPLTEGGLPAATVDRVVDIRAFDQHKLDAISAHRSQLGDGDPRDFLVQGIVGELLGVERFHHAAGPGLAAPLTDLFVNP